MAVEFVKLGAHERWKIRILRGVVVNRVPATEGDIVEVPASEAHFVISQGSAVRYVEPPKPPEPEPEPEKEEAPKIKADRPAARKTKEKSNAL